jgi:hypothetical protein
MVLGTNGQHASLGESWAREPLQIPMTFGARLEHRTGTGFDLRTEFLEGIYLSRMLAEFRMALHSRRRTESRRNLWLQIWIYIKVATFVPG